jgi:hypothetical protein
LPVRAIPWLRKGIQRETNSRPAATPRYAKGAMLTVGAQDAATVTPGRD